MEQECRFTCTDFSPSIFKGRGMSINVESKKMQVEWDGFFYAGGYTGFQSVSSIRVSFQETHSETGLPKYIVREKVSECPERSEGCTCPPQGGLVRLWRIEPACRRQGHRDLSVLAGVLLILTGKFRIESTSLLRKRTS